MPRTPRRLHATFALTLSLLSSRFAAAQDATAPGQAPAPAASPAVPPAPAAAPVAATAAPSSNDIQKLREEVQALKTQVEATRAAQAAAAATPPPAPAPPPPPPPPPAKPVRPLGYESFWPWGLPPEGISFGGYFQSQYETHQDSQDQLAQGGALLNQDRFSIRRARVNLTGEWEYAAVGVELDGNTTNGMQVDLHKAEVSLQYRPDRDKPPILMGTMGMFDTPFGYELVESPRTRWFMERSKASLAMWPSEPDIGVRFAGALAFFRWTIAGLNGHPFAEKGPFALQDPISPKDVLLRFGFDSTPRDDLHLAGGVSTIRGRGFHSGADAQPAMLVWNDLNGDGLVQMGETQGGNAMIHQPSQTFERWAVNIDLRAQFRWKPGVLKVYGEFTAAKNYDRGMFIADPIAAGVDMRELGYFVGVTQELFDYGVVGFRYDYYDPNSDLFDNRQGRVIPYSEALTTYSPLVGLVLPGRARLLFQYDINRNKLARDSRGVPTNLQNNAAFVRLQVEL